MRHIKPKQLSPDQTKFLSMFIGTKSAYRRDNWNRDDKTRHLDFDQLQAQLLDLGLLKKNKAGAVSCIYSYEEAKYFLEISTSTVETLQAEITELAKDIELQYASVAKMPDLQWPYDGAKSMAKQYLRRLEQGLEAKRLMLKTLNPNL